MTALSPRAARLAALIDDRRGKKVLRDNLLRLFQQADPTSAGKVVQHALLADCIRELAEANIVRLPAEGSYESSPYPPLPNFVFKVTEAAD